MKILPIIKEYEPVLREIYEDLHRHPELGFEETRTSKIVAEHLRDFGVDEVHEGFGKTGVVGIIKGKHAGNRQIGLRADMDALPITEESGVAYASETQGKMHACGHDGHTAMLLGAAKHLAETRDFEGSVVLIFQPAEEGMGGALAMVKEGLFERFPCDEIYGIHNSPNGKSGHFEICKGDAMAGAAFLDIEILGKGGHAARPQDTKDPLHIAASLMMQLNAIVSREVPPLETLVLSITQMHGGTAYNVIPQKAHLTGTIRYFKDEIFALASKRIEEITKGVALAHDCEIKTSIRHAFTVLRNDADLSDAYMEAARDIVGEKFVTDQSKPVTGSEDFADMLAVVPGTYGRLGHSGEVGLHHPSFVLGQEILPIGASILARVAERRLSAR